MSQRLLQLLKTNEVQQDSQNKEGRANHNGQYDLNRGNSNGHSVLQGMRL